MRRFVSIGVIVGMALAVLAIVPTPAYAWHAYAGNSRSIAAGIRADIRTPTVEPVLSDGAIANFVSNIDSTDGAVDWVQVGWCQGEAPDGGFNDNPHSYREASIDAFYDFDDDPYSDQPLNFARAYEVVNIGYDMGSYGWQTKIAGTSRGTYYGFAERSVVVGESEIIDGWDNDCMAGFNDVQCKVTFGSSYTNLDQDNRFCDDPFTSLIWYYTYKYSTHAGDL